MEYVAFGLAIVLSILLIYVLIKSSKSKSKDKDKYNDSARNRINKIYNDDTKWNGSGKGKNERLGSLTNHIADANEEAEHRKIGEEGEKFLTGTLMMFEPYGAKVLSNVYIPKRNGQTSEVDSILITKQGLLVFEMKNRGGKIAGGEYDEDWTQTLPGPKGTLKIHNFKNPISQNANHITYLRERLGNMRIFNIVVFSDRSDLSGVTENGEYIYVIRRDQVQSAVRQIMLKYDEVLNDSRIDTLYKKMKPWTQVSNYEKSKHVADIKMNEVRRGRYQ